MIYRLMLVLGLMGYVSAASATVVLNGSLHKWQVLTLDVNEPSLLTDESANNPNPFLDITLSVRFTAPSGEIVEVPGFYAGDGNGGGTGSVWRVRFAPGETGLWEYRVRFREGDEIAVADDLSAGNALPADGNEGTFSVTAIASDARGFTAKGRLEYDGHHYLKFADGNYWIKGGVDSPENFFGFAGFDNTLDQVGGAGSDGLTMGLHRYEEHVTDWRDGDPDFSNSETGFSGRGIIGAVNYLSEKGVNSLYFLPLNLGGDGRETYPFIDINGTRNANTHYDISKLHQWNLVLNHMQNREIAAHFMLAETEGGNTNWLDNGQLGIERKLFYRELVARFSYLMAVKWNLSEESRYGDEKHREFARYIREIDWAQHQLAVHTHRDRVGERYDGLLGNTDFDATSIQYSPEQAELHVETWRSKSAVAGWPWVVDMDENSPAGEGLTDTNAEELRRTVLYPVYFSGGNIEWYFGYHDLPLGGDIRTENFRTRESMFNYMRYAREFMEEHLPFHEMEPDDTLHSMSEVSDIQVFAKAGEVYAMYLPEGNVGGELSVRDGNWDMQWFDPRAGEFVGDVVKVTGDRIVQGDPPDGIDSDWVVLVQAQLEVAEPVVLPVQPIDGGDDSDTDEPEIGAAMETMNGGGVCFGLLVVLLLMSRCRRVEYEKSPVTEDQY